MTSQTTAPEGYIKKETMWLVMLVALASFKKAVSINPDHPTARFNSGIVLLYDMKDRDAAIQTWKELVQLHPDAKAPNGQLVSEIIDEVKEP